MVRRFLDLIADTWILDLAAGLLLGLAVLNFVQSVSGTVVQFWTSKGEQDALGFANVFNSLTVQIGDRTLFLASVIESALTLAVVLFIVVFVIRRLGAADASE